MKRNETNEDSFSSYYQERVCPICNKHFIKQPQHIYRIQGKKRDIPVCSWTCQRKWEKQKEEARKAKHQEKKYLNIVRKMKEE